MSEIKDTVVVGGTLALPFAFGEHFLGLVIPEGKPPKDDVMMLASMNRFQSKLQELTKGETDSIVAIENMAAEGYIPSIEGILSDEFNNVIMDFLVSRKWKTEDKFVNELRRVAIMCWQNILDKNPTFTDNYNEFIANLNKVEEDIKAAFEDEEEFNDMFADVEEESATETVPVENIDSEGPIEAAITTEEGVINEPTFSDTETTETATDPEKPDAVPAEEPLVEPEPEPEPVETVDSLSLEPDVPVVQRLETTAPIVAPAPAPVILSDAVMEARANITAKVIMDFMSPVPETIEGLSSDRVYCSNFDFELNYGFPPTEQVIAIIQGRIETLDAKILAIQTAKEEAEFAELVRLETEEKAGKIIDAINVEMQSSLTREEVQFELDLVSSVTTEEFEGFSELAANIQAAKMAKIELLNNLLLTVYSYDVKETEKSIEPSTEVPVEEPAPVAERIENVVIESSVIEPVAETPTPIPVATEAKEEVTPLWKRQGFKSEEAMLKSIEDGLAAKHAKNNGGSSNKEKKEKKYERTPEHDFHASQGTKKYSRIGNNLQSLSTMMRAQQSTRGREGFEIAQPNLTGNSPVLAFPANLDIGNRLTMGVCHFSFNQMPYITGLHPNNLMKTSSGKDIGNAFEWPTMLKTVKVSQRLRGENAAYFTAEVPIKVPYIVEGVLINVEQKNRQDGTSFAVKSHNTKLYTPIVVEATVPNMISMLNFGHTFVGTVVAPDSLAWQALSRKKFHVFYNPKSMPTDYTTYLKSKEEQQ